MKVFKTQHGNLVRNICLEAGSVSDYFIYEVFDNRLRRWWTEASTDPGRLTMSEQENLAKWYDEQGGGIFFGYDLNEVEGQIPVAGRNLRNEHQAVEAAKHALFVNFPDRTYGTVWCRPENHNEPTLLYTMHYNGKALSIMQLVDAQSYQELHRKPGE